MSNYRRIWAEAIKANQALALNHDAGTSMFEQLVGRHPEDGMIFYERGEAFEHLGFLDKAEQDFAEAERLLTSPHWKQVARLALQRIGRKRCADTKARMVSAGMPQWDAFHRVHALPQLPHDMRVRALSAISRIDAEPESSGVDLRWCVERIVLEVHHQFPSEPLPRGLGPRIEFLRHEGTIPEHIAGRMECVCAFGNSGAHSVGSKRDGDVVTSLSAFVGVLEWAGAKMWPGGKNRLCV